MESSIPESTLRALTLGWLERLGYSPRKLEILSGDVSLRRYVRVELATESAIVAAYPPAIRASCDCFLTTTRLLSAAGVRVPKVIAADCRDGLMLIEDVGDRTLYDLEQLDARSLARYFWKAVEDIGRIQSIATADLEGLNPPLAGSLLRQELDRTWRTVIAPLCTPGSGELVHDLGRLFDTICANLDRDRPVPCHRDFMARNLVPVQPVPNLAVLDHQDLRLGPPQYDLASLLNDSLFPDSDLESDILDRVLGPGPELRLGYHRAAAQRTLKAAGTYTMFAERGFERHRRLIAPTLRRTLGHLRLLPEAATLHEEIGHLLAPHLDSADDSDGAAG